jgi:titin
MTKRAVGIAVALFMIVSALFIGINIQEGTEGAPTRVAPSVPLDFKAESMNNQIKLTWDHPESDGDSSRIGYVLRRGLNTDDMNIRKSDFGPFVTQFIDNTVTNGITYYYDLAAINEIDGVGTRTDLIAEKPVGPASPVINVSADYGSRVVYLEWETPESDGGDDLVGYRIMRGPLKTSLNEWFDIPVQNSYEDQDVENGVSYYYAVRASNSYVVNGTMHEPVQVTPRGTPGAPGDFNVTGRDREVFLNWTAPADDGGGSIMRYNIYRGLTEGTVELYFSPIGLRSEYLDTNITNGETYFYSVAAINMEGEGAKTDIVEVKPIGVPDSPLNLTVQPGDASAYLTWKAPTNDGGTPITNYRVYKTQKGAEMELVKELGIVFEYTDENLTNGDTYYYQIRAKNDQGIGWPSKNEEVKPDYAPSPPPNFRTKEFEGYINILWAHPPLNLDYPILGFKIFKGTSMDDLPYLMTVNSSVASYKDQDVEVGTEYFYRIQSFSAIGDGEFSEIITGIPYSKPSLTRDLALAPSDGIVRLTWTPPEFDGGREIINYKIYRGETRDTLAVIDTISGSLTYYNDTNVDNGVTYFYSIMAVNGMMEGNLTPIQETEPTGPPTSPRSLVTSVVGDTILLEWELPRSNGGEPITGFVILRGPSKFNLTEYDQVGLIFNYTDTDVELGEEYFYAIVAVNDVGRSTQSSSSGSEIYEEADDSKEEQDMLPLILGSIVVVVIIAGLVIFVIIMTKKKQKEEVEGAQEFEESEKEKEHRLVLERRKQMEEFTDVALNTQMAHAHDHDEHHYTYEDLYGNLSKEEEEVSSGEVEPPEPAENGPEVPDYQPPEPVPEETPQPQPAPPEEPQAAEPEKENGQGEYIPPA